MYFDCKDQYTFDTIDTRGKNKAKISLSTFEILQQNLTQGTLLNQKNYYFYGSTGGLSQYSSRLLFHASVSSLHVLETTNAFEVSLDLWIRS